MSLFVRGAALAAVAAAAGCAASDAPKTDRPAGEAAATPATAGGPNVVTVTAREYVFEAPRQIPAGLTTFRFMVEGKEPHHGILVRLDDGKTLEDLAAAMKNHGPPPSWAHLDGGMMIGDPQHGSSVTMTLTQGKYALICFIPSPDGVAHAAKGMFHPIEVTAPTGPEAAEPQPDIVLTLADYEFRLSKPLTPGAHVIRVETAQGQPHELVLVKLGDGVTPAQVVAAEMGQRKGARPPYTFVGGVAPMEAGRHAFIEATLEPGNYALICFVPDAKDGKPHLMHGMMQQIKVG
jgi:hypothetical protein